MMKLKKLIQQTWVLLPLIILNTQAQDAAVEEQKELLKKGNTWYYDVTLTVPKGTNFEPEFQGEGVTSDNGTVYQFKERQQSIGEHHVEEIKEETSKINIYINNKMRKQQLLKMTDGILLYYGTYQIDAEDPSIKNGFITKAPIPLYSDRAKIAEKWQWKHNKIPLFQFRVISKDTQVTVKAGKFKADKIRMEQVDSNTGKVLVSKEIWFSKGTGIIKETEKQYIPDGKAILKSLELTKFSNEIVK